MSDTIIKLQNISKSYRLSSRQGYRTFREAVSDTLFSPFRRSSAAEILWALKDVSMDVRRGEAVGIIGRNGAGKSTLLKILSRITEPTSGRAELRGRVGSLLEVGTGFHPELSGRENIFLYGAILGMSRREIARKFDEIVSFSEVERFIDTPVKRYSSGMYMRLAFSVAAHLEPEILLVDEVLAVGDAIFQRKCIKKMADVTSGGRTVLFISHNMDAVSSLCRRSVVLEAGRVSYSGPTPAAVSMYLSLPGAVSGGRAAINERRDRSGDGAVRLTDLYAADASGARLEAVPNGGTVRLAFEFETISPDGASDVDLQFVVLKRSGEPVCQFGTRFTGKKIAHLPHKGRIICSVERFPLVPDIYRLDSYIVAGGQPSDYLLDAAVLHVVDGDYYGSGYQVFEKESRFLLDGQIILSGDR